jgi:2-amino-4-hydroxy-6-hydroxymethyldihydropteridine diphosphokinase
MTQVYIGIGSNIDKVKNINGSLSSLRNYFGKINVSPIYQSKAVGIDGETLILPK